MKRLLLSLCSLFLLPGLTIQAAEPEKYPVPRLGPTETYGRNIQRTMTLLATSTPQKRNTVRILFYGQSLTEQNWWKLVADDLRRRFPHANIIAENRALGGFASQLLVKTAETDLYPFYPDLVIFHVFGSHIEYENILKRIRQRTTAEILLQSDRIYKDEELEEETNAARLTPKNWSPWMNYAFLPSMARKYGAEFVNIHDLWKDYLREHKLKAGQLLSDGTHFNDHGCYLMAEITKAYLRYDPSFGDANGKNRVKTYEVGKDVHWKDGKLRLEFEGNRVDVICQEGSAPPAKVSIDGKNPADIPELYALTRTTSFPGSGWPCLLRVGAEKRLQVEEWTLTLSDVAPDMKSFRFRLAGSRTGPDGEGNRAERFVSKSGRVVIDPADWNFDYARAVFKTSVKDGFLVRWKVVPQFVEEFVSPGIKDPSIETTVTLAQGLHDAKHTLEITGGPKVPIKAIRVYLPPER